LVARDAEQPRPEVRTNLKIRESFDSRYEGALRHIISVSTQGAVRRQPRPHRRLMMPDDGFEGTHVPRLCKVVRLLRQIIGGLVESTVHNYKWQQSR
jgi:hypothetical protein